MTEVEYYVELDKKRRYLERMDSMFRCGRGEDNRRYDVIPSRMVGIEVCPRREYSEGLKVEVVWVE